MIFTDFADADREYTHALAEAPTKTAKAGVKRRFSFFFNLHQLIARTERPHFSVCVACAYPVLLRMVLLSAGGALLHLGDKLAHLCPNKDFVFLRASIVPQVCVCISVCTCVHIKKPFRSLRERGFFPLRCVCHCCATGHFFSVIGYVALADGWMDAENNIVFVGTLLEVAKIAIIAKA